MMFWSLDTLKAITAGAWLARAENPPALIQGVAIDSRVLRRGEVFLALQGERTDGHRYLRAAADAASPLAIIDHEDAIASSPQERATLLAELARKGMSVLRVTDSKAALLKLAAEYRKTLEGTRVISVSGSNGKTTTTRLIESVLSPALRGVASQKSFNNDIGVPLTILSASRGDQYLLCEVGTNAPGEIATLARVVAPDIAVFVSLGREHLEGLSSLKGVLEEEASLAASISPSGLAIANAAPPEFADTIRLFLNSRGVASDPSRPPLLRFGTQAAAPDADLRVSDITVTPQGTRFTLNGRTTVTIPIAGEHNALNAAAAFAVGHRLGLDEAQIVTNLAAARGADMRSALLRIETGTDPIHVLMDAYNANPESAHAALRTFTALAHTIKPARRVLVLGDMLELGEAGPDCHREIGEAALALAPDLAILVGSLSLYTAERLRRGMPADRVIPLPDLSSGGDKLVASMLKPGDMVLFKASRRMALEQVLEALRASASADAQGEPTPIVEIRPPHSTSSPRRTP